MHVYVHVHTRNFICGENVAHIYIYVRVLLFCVNVFVYTCMQREITCMLVPLFRTYIHTYMHTYTHTGTTCLLIPNTTANGTLLESPFLRLLDMQLNGVRRPLVFTFTVCAYMHVESSFWHLYVCVFVWRIYFYINT